MGSKLSDNKTSVDKPDNVNTVIELLHVTTSFRLKAKSIISLLSNRVLEDAIADLSYHKNTLDSLRDDIARNKHESKYEDVDVIKLKSGCDYSYAPNIEKNSY